MFCTASFKEIMAHFCEQNCILAHAYDIAAHLHPHHLGFFCNHLGSRFCVSDPIYWSTFFKIKIDTFGSDCNNYFFIINRILDMECN